MRAITNDQPAYNYARTTALNATKQELSAAAANLYGYKFINPNTSPVYVKLYDAIAASVTVGTTAPKIVYVVPPGDGTTPGLLQVEPDGEPIAGFATRITIAAVTGLADNSSAAPATDCYAEVVHK